MEESEYGKLIPKRERELSDKLENIRDSASFKVSEHLVAAVQRPHRLLILPISLPWIIFKSLGRKEIFRIIFQILIIPFTLPLNFFTAISKRSIDPSSSGKMKTVKRQCVVLFSDESQGGIHLQRALAIESYIKQQKENTQVIHVTLESKDYFLRMTDALVYRLPSRKRINDLEPKRWNKLTEYMLNAILDTYNPENFIFDAKYPFRGVLNSIKRRHEMNRYWIQAEFENIRVNNLPIDSFDIFDAIIHPTMTATPTHDVYIGRSGRLFTGPMVMTQLSDADMTKQNFIDSRGISSDKLLVLFDAGKKTPQSSKIIEYMLTNEAIHIITDGFQKVGNHHLPRIHQLHEHTIADLYQITDIAIIQANLHSIHSAVNSMTPSLCILESQHEGKRLADLFTESKNTFITLDKNANQKTLIDAVNLLSDANTQEKMKKIMSRIKIEDGVQQFVSMMYDSSDD